MEKTILDKQKLLQAAKEEKWSGKKLLQEAELKDKESSLKSDKARIELYAASERLALKEGEMANKAVAEANKMQRMVDIQNANIKELALAKLGIQAAWDGGVSDLENKLKDLKRREESIEEKQRQLKDIGEKNLLKEKNEPQRQDSMNKEALLKHQLFVEKNDKNNIQAKVNGLQDYLRAIASKLK